MNLVNTVRDYYVKRGLTFPNFDNAMKFTMTEIAEVFELDLARTGGWVRNNPQNKPTFSKESMAEELGDAIMMLIVAGIAEGVDPIEALENKMRRKLGQATVTVAKEGVGNGVGVLVGNSPAQIVTDGTAEWWKDNLKEDNVISSETINNEFNKYRQDIYEGKA